MRNITFKTPEGDLSIEVADALVNRVATINCVPSDAVSDRMILGFFREASDVALRKALDEYLDSDGSAT